jgi:uncharacterized cupredoxin-like copper-binding protein
MTRTVWAALVVVALAAPAIAANVKHAYAQPRGHSRAVLDFAAGEPGNPRQPARLITITMQETYSGKMLFAPDKIEVPVGEQVKFVLRNLGQVEHSFVLGPTSDDLSLTTKPTVPNARLVPAATESDLLWRFSKPGRFEFTSILPGQASAGMKGTIVVGEFSETD